MFTHANKIRIEMKALSSSVNIMLELVSADPEI